MEYIKKVNWRRYGRQYYRVYINYIDEDGNNKRLTCRYNASMEIKPFSKLGRILQLKNNTKLSLHNLKRMLSYSDYELLKNIDG